MTISDDDFRARVERDAAARGLSVAEVLRRAGLHRTTLNRRPAHGHRSDVVNRIGRELDWPEAQATVISLHGPLPPGRDFGERLALIADLASHLHVIVRDRALRPPDLANEIARLTTELLDLARSQAGGSAAEAPPPTTAAEKPQQRKQR